MTWCHQVDLPKSKLISTELYIFCCTGCHSSPDNWPKSVVSGELIGNWYEWFCLKCVFLPQNAPNCTDLHLYFQKFSGGDTPDFHNWGGADSPQTRFARIHSPIFSELPRPLFIWLMVSVINWTNVNCFSHCFSSLQCLCIVTVSVASVSGTGDAVSRICCCICACDFLTKIVLRIMQSIQPAGHTTHQDSWNRGTVVGFRKCLCDKQIAVVSKQLNAFLSTSEWKQLWTCVVSGAKFFCDKLLQIPLWKMVHFAEEFANKFTDHRSKAYNRGILEIIQVLFIAVF